MAKSEIKVNLETMFEGKPIELEFVKQAIKEKLERTEKEKGKGCPANNTTCRYLHQNVCIHLLPELSNKDGKILCGSMR